MRFRRFAIYFVPPAGDFRAAGDAWLGHGLAGGETPEGLCPVAEQARRYGFHATMQPPFKAVAGATVETLERTLSALCRRLEPGCCDGLEIGEMGRFLALKPQGDASALARIASATLRAFASHRAPLTEAESARYAARRLTPRQRGNLAEWGYPFVMQDFRWHMTLTDRLDPEALRHWRAMAMQHFTRVAPRPFILDRLSLVGEGEDGLFQEIAAHPLAGAYKW